jgi:pimeloyl-ACP methyl ester carboxylesterase
MPLPISQRPIGVSDLRPYRRYLCPTRQPGKSRSFPAISLTGQAARRRQSCCAWACAMNAVDVLARVRAEALNIHRREDRLMPIEAGRRLAAGLPQARFMTLEGKAHPPWVDGGAVADIAHSFFAGEDDPLASALSPAFPTGRAIDCRLDEANRELALEDRSKPVTPLEYGAMLALVRASGRVVTRD